MSAIRRRSLLYKGNAVPEGWYKPADTPNGVFACIYKDNQIYAIESSVYTADKASFTDYLMGVAVVTADTRIVIGVTMVDTRSKRWDYDGTGGLISGVTTTTSSSSAQSDYKGKFNSAAAIAALGSDAAAASGCENNTFLNGDTGYLPSAGQMTVIWSNKTAIGNLLTAMGGKALSTGYYWTSTQYDSSHAWRLYISNGVLFKDVKSTAYRIRPIIDYPEL